MNKLIRLYNQNRKQLFILILIVVAIILSIRFFDNLAQKENEKNLNSGTISSSTSSTTTYKPQQSAISSSTVPNSIYKEQSKIIDDFIKYCNEGNTKEAYDLLSKDCKEIMFPTLEYFIENYYKMIFNEKKIYSIKNWTNNTYKINMTENILSTGKVSNGVSIEDYFTIVNAEKKLNINGFIGRTNLNTSTSNNNLEFNILYEDQYMDYVIYTLKVKNKTDKTVLLDSGENTQNMYISDQNNVKYTSYRNEVTDAELKILPNSENIIKIKYASTYVMNRNINYLVFKDIILDSNAYDEYILKGNYTDREKVIIEF